MVFVRKLRVHMRAEMQLQVLLLLLLFVLQRCAVIRRMALHGKEHAVVGGVACIVIVAVQAISKVTITVVVNAIVIVVVIVCSIHGSHGASIVVSNTNTTATDSFIVANNIHIEISQCLSLAAIYRGV